MPKTYHVSEKDSPLAVEIMRAAFPAYKGRKFKVAEIADPSSFGLYGCYWSGGSRSSYAGIQLVSGKVGWFGGINPLRESEPKTNVPLDCAIVEHSIFCGKDTGLTLHLRPENVAKMLPAGDGDELTEDEKIVLIATRSYKNTYAGRTNVRFEEARRKTGITQQAYEDAKSLLFLKGYLKRHGKSYKITNEGRNACGNESLYSLRKDG
jgi:hypothetical protein